MINPISSAAPTHAAAPVQSNTATNQSKQPASTAAHQDTVQLSSAAQKILQEATETPAQTAKEAASGDAQARRLLAKETEDTTTK